MSEKAKTPELAEVARIDLDQRLFGGWLRTLQNPDKVLQLEAGGDITIYDDIGRDDRVGSNLRTRALAVIGKEWTVEPAGEDARDQQVADYVEQVFGGFSFDRARRSILRGGLLKGYAVSEIMWEVSEGDVFISDMKHRAQRRFCFDLDSNLRLLTRSNPFEGDNLTKQYPRKFQTFIFGDEAETPYGVGLGREVYWPWWFKKNDIKFWRIFADKFAAPTPIGKYPASALPEEKATLMDACRAFQTDGAVTIPEGMSIDLLEAARSGSINTYSELAAFMNTAISIVILGQTATTEGTAGKLGNEESKENVRDDLTKADADALCESLNGQSVKWLVDYQFPGYSGGRKYPRIWINCGDEEDQKALSERDKNLSDTGVIFVKQHYVDTYGIPEDHFELADKKVSDKPPVQADFAEKAGQGDTTASITIKLAEEADGAMSSWIDQVKVALDEAKDLEEFRDQLLELYGDLDPADLGNVISYGMSLADLVGRDEVNNGD